MSATSVNRILNFSAGPGILPLEVLEQAQRDFVALPGVGMSVAEISHRSKTFEQIINECEADIRSLAGIPANYHVLFLQGGASMQFAQVPLNLLRPARRPTTSSPEPGARKPPRKPRRLVRSTSPRTRRPATSVTCPIPARCRSRPVPPTCTTRRTRPSRASSSRAISTSAPRRSCATPRRTCSASRSTSAKYGLIYAGAQKNLGPAGVTLVIVRDDLVGKAPASVPTMLNYATHAKEKSLYNTPPCLPIYLVGLVMKWLTGNGGLSAMGAVNERKAAKLYAEIDRTGFYKGHAAKTCRSNMNVTFRLPTEELEAAFAKEATAAGLNGLKGHRSVGGIRASIYNAFPETGVDTLVSFMQEFERKNG